MVTIFKMAPFSNGFLSHCKYGLNSGARPQKVGRIILEFFKLGMIKLLRSHFYSNFHEVTTVTQDPLRDCCNFRLSENHMWPEQKKISTLQLLPAGAFKQLYIVTVGRSHTNNSLLSTQNIQIRLRSHDAGTISKR